MGETVFGSGPQVWSTLSVPAFSYFQTLPGSRVFGGAQQPSFGPSSAPFATAAMLGAPLVAAPSSPDPATTGGNPLPVTAAPIGTLPTFTATELATAITPQALLLAVAMRRGQPMGPTTDQEIEDFMCDALDLLSGAADVEIRCEAGRAMLTGSVSNKRVKRDVGEIAWAIPNVHDVQNNITIAMRRRSRAGNRETEAGPGQGQARKQA